MSRATPPRRERFVQVELSRGPMPKHRVLIVDDHPDTAEIACALISFEGHECRSANTARDACVQASELLPDIAILDLDLPDLSGYELAALLRQLAGERELFLAALTGWGQPTERTRAIEAGFDHFVIKPADRIKLREILERAEGKR